MRTLRLALLAGILAGAAVVVPGGPAAASALSAGPSMGLNDHVKTASSIIDVQRRWRRRGINPWTALGIGAAVFGTLYAIDAATRRRYRSYDELDAYCEDRYDGYYDPERGACVVQ